MPTPFPFVAGSVLQASQLNSISELPTRTLTGSGAAVAADAYSRVILNGTSITYTINTSTFTAGQVVEIYNANSTTATIAAGAGTTLNGAGGLTLAQYQTAELYAVSATAFVLWKSDVSVTAPAVVQVKNAQKTDMFTTTSTTYTDVTGLSVSITPTSASNKILILAAVTFGNNPSTNNAFIQLVRDTTAIAIGDAAGTRTRASQTFYTVSGSNQQAGATIWLDSPATTSATTYKVQLRAGTAATVRVNASADDTDDPSRARTVSSITVMEVTP